MLQLEYELGPSQHSDSTLAALSAAMARPNWQVVGDVDVPLKQHATSLKMQKSLTRPTWFMDLA